MVVVYFFPKTRAVFFKTVADPVPLICRSNDFLGILSVT